MEAFKQEYDDWGVYNYCLNIIALVFVEMFRRIEKFIWAWDVHFGQVLGYSCEHYYQGSLVLWLKRGKSWIMTFVEYACQILT